VRLALFIEGQEGVTWEDWVALAEACERHGIETLFRSDHYISQGNEAGNVAHDAWTTIAGLAARTTTLRFGTLVSPVTFRHPGLLANAVATADHISGGRVELGLGAGWMEREHRAYAFPFPGTSTRVAMFREQLEIVHRLWTEDRVDFRGEHYTLEDAPGQPTPVQRPHPPLIVGGSGKRGTVEPALQFADEYNLPFVGPEDVARVKKKVGDRLRVSAATTLLIGATRDEALDRARTLYGRVPRDLDFDQWLERFSARATVGSVEEVAARLREFAQAGAERVMLQHLLHRDLEAVALLPELRDRLDRAGTAGTPAS
jgi:F420-dependent oxidoreductase-like protein